MKASRQVLGRSTFDLGSSRVYSLEFCKEIKAGEEGVKGGCAMVSGVTGGWL